MIQLSKSRISEGTEEEEKEREREREHHGEHAGRTFG